MSERMYPGMHPDERTTFAPYSAFDIPADLRELHGRYDVEATARRVRNFRYAEEWMTMIMGGWVATVPEVPVKTGLGKVIWESAQAVAEPERPDLTIEKLVGLFDVLQPHLVEAYETTMRETDALRERLDSAPTSWASSFARAAV